MREHAQRIARRAHAKINLGLRVCAQRPDGFHAIETVFHRIALFDDIVLTPAAGIEIHSTDPMIPEDESNICHKAVRLVQNYLKTPDGVRCSITKNIPVGAGLGGGSSDGAAVLRELPVLWGKHMDEETLRSLSLALGSDVTYFLGEGSAAAHGRGEILEYFPLDIPFVILLCYPNIGISTSWAYLNVTPRGPSHNDLQTRLLDGLKDPPLLMERLTNDFEDPVFAAYPAIADVKEGMLRDGALFSSLSGSGSSVYGFFSDDQTARRSSERFGEQGYRTFITPPHFRA